VVGKVGRMSYGQAGGVRSSDSESRGGHVPGWATEPLHRVAILGNHLPRQCGIATFTTDLAEAIVAVRPALDCFVLAVNDEGRRHAYPPRVQFEITEPDLVSYRRAADYLNVRRVDVVSVQHEYGIFGGKAGSHVLTLLRELRMPIVTTLHTVLEQPDERQRQVMDELAALSTRLVVMSDAGADLLHRVHQVPRDKIDHVAHGIPALPAGEHKDPLGLSGKTVLLTFGLLSPDKGVEYVIDALPAILARHPDVVYVVLGATHPHVKARAGEAYRLGLVARAVRLGVSDHVVFHDRFVSTDELTTFLAAADVYLTPYLNMEQSTSGTLAYAVGGGRAVISTPYRHARELLAEGRGLLVPRADAGAIAREVDGLLSDPAERAALCARAAAYGVDKRWPVVAEAYLATFTRARHEHAAQGRARYSAPPVSARRDELPEVNFEHLRALTDQTGILQHAAFNVPSYAEGYCVDDNARALLLMALAEDSGTNDPALVRALATRYLAFVNHAFEPRTGRFRNFMSYAHRWDDRASSEDSHGRAMWALGTVVGRSRDPGRHSLAGRLFHLGMPVVSEFTSPRAWAYVLLGLAEYLRAFWGDSQAEATQRLLATRLRDLFRRTSQRDWPWFEDRLTYCNPRLPQALIVTARWLHDEELLAVGLRSLGWLLEQQTTADGVFAPIGSDGFYPRGQARARYDQQPVEAGAMVSACLDARRLTGDARWSEGAHRAFDWFLGHNELQRPLYDAATGACHDGLHADRVNANQGAESTLSFLLALFELRATDRPDLTPRPPRPDRAPTPTPTPWPSPSVPA
jgi:glycosyltransferase involved in cell wall biosynthesis